MTDTQERNSAPEEEFLRVYDAHADAVFRYCARRVYDREKAKEIMQESFMKTWEYMTKGNVVKHIRAFVYRTATNLIIDTHKKKKTNLWKSSKKIQIQ